MEKCINCGEYFEPEEGSMSKEGFMDDGCIQDLCDMGAKELGEVFDDKP
jgi:hypothetical protein